MAESKSERIERFLAEVRAWIAQRPNVDFVRLQVSGSCNDIVVDLRDDA